MTNFEIQCAISDVEPGRIEMAKRLYRKGFKAWGIMIEAHITHRQAVAVCESCGRMEQ